MTTKNKLSTTKAMTTKTMITVAAVFKDLCCEVWGPGGDVVIIGKELDDTIVETKN